MPTQPAETAQDAPSDPETHDVLLRALEALSEDEPLFRVIAYNGPPTTARMLYRLLYYAERPGRSLIVAVLVTDGYNVSALLPDDRDQPVSFNPYERRCVARLRERLLHPEQVISFVSTPGLYRTETTLTPPRCFYTGEPVGAP